MELVEIKEFVASLAVLTTILQFLSGILVCKQYVVNKTTAEASPLPFICGFISAGIWLLYGLAKHNNKIIMVNTIGVTLMFFYTIIFYIFTIKKSSVLKQFLAVLVMYIFVIFYNSAEEDKYLLTNRLGTMACSLTLITIASPLSKLLYVIRRKSTDCLPFPLILMTFIVSSLWFLYGLLEEDVFLSAPNFIGGTLAAFQLSLFIIYPSIPSSPLITKNTLA
ncbi:sugar transporter SWEET1 [Aricia agestis]|uniref:sugar transporter SWEET1 n=1 Tax=Aricia agestis TaxID=91739 RepID=UPI001C2019D0|nr:sugar transporter SWEET1 [Aricia agestis]